MNLRGHAVNEELAIEPEGQPQLDYLPVGLFGSVMGLTGLSVAWRLAEASFGAPPWISLSIGAASVIAFTAMAIGYGLKALTAWAAVEAEFRHPIAGNLFGTILVSLLLLPIVIAPFALLTAKAMWIAGAIGMVAFAWMTVCRWMTDRQQIAHATPTWVIPVVGLLDVPLALPSLGLPSLHGLAIFALAVGLFFAVPLFTLIFSRLVFEPAMPDVLKPTLMILVAPFAVGYSTYLQVAGGQDLFAEALYMLTLFMLAVLIGQMRHLPVCCPFRVSWWAVSFPLAAAAIASLRVAMSEPGLVTETIAATILAVATLTVAGLLARTLFGLARGELRTLSS